MAGAQDYEPHEVVELLGRRWLLDQGLVNLCTDAPSTDNPADTHYPNHLLHLHARLSCR